MIIVECGCSKFIEKIDNGKQNTTYAMSECEFCQKTNGDYGKSPHWKEQQPKEKRR